MEEDPRVAGPTVQVYTRSCCLLLCRHVIDLPLPGLELREQLWKKLVPKRAPMAADIDFKGLAERYQLQPEL